MKGTNFYNTTGMSGPDLFTVKSKAKNQEQIILDIFKAHKGWLTRQQLQIKYRFKASKPLYDTSASRSLRNLTMAEMIEKSEERFKGGRGVDVHKWKIKN